MGRGTELKMISHYLSLRVNTRSLKKGVRFSKFLDVSHWFDMTILEVLNFKLEELNGHSTFNSWHLTLSN